VRSIGPVSPRRRSGTACARQGWLNDVDHVALNQDGRANLVRKLGYLLSYPPNPGLVYTRWQNRRRRAGIPELLTTAFPGQSVRAVPHRIEHHLAHLSSAFFLERSVGHGIRVRDYNPWSGLFPAFTRHLLSGAHAVPRVSALRRRVQGDGARSLRYGCLPR
jgi:hypothetical protein